MTTTSASAGNEWHAFDGRHRTLVVAGLFWPGLSRGLSAGRLNAPLVQPAVSLLSAWRHRPEGASSCEATLPGAGSNPAALANSRIESGERPPAPRSPARLTTKAAPRRQYRCQQTQSRPFPARAGKVMESAAADIEPNAARASESERQESREASSGGSTLDFVGGADTAGAPGMRMCDGKMHPSYVGKAEQSLTADPTHDCPRTSAIVRQACSSAWMAPCPGSSHPLRTWACLWTHSPVAWLAAGETISGACRNAGIRAPARCPANGTLTRFDSWRALQFALRACWLAWARAGLFLGASAGLGTSPSRAGATP